MKYCESACYQRMTDTLNWILMHGAVCDISCRAFSCCCWRYRSHDNASVMLTRDPVKRGARTRHASLTLVYRTTDCLNFADRSFQRSAPAVWNSVNNCNCPSSASDRVATRPVFAGTSRFPACLSRVPVKRLPGRYMSRFWASVLGLFL